MVLAFVVLTLVIGFLFVEKQLVNRSVNGLQLRIHVNGTRGKSSVTKYIASGLSVKDNSVMAKVTGVIPSIILSGKFEVLGRRGVARVQEQFHVLRLASKKDIRSLVLECMSISPELQQLESKCFKPHLYIITNIKDDHREVMGSSLKQQAESICNAIPENTTVVTNETRFLDLIREKAAIKGSKVIIPKAISTELAEELPFGVFPENVAIALAVCELAGIEGKYSGKAILESLRSDSSAYHLINTTDKEIKFLNAFSVNDVESTESFISYWKNKFSSGNKFSVLLNTRSDRPLRTDQLTDWINSRADDIDRVFISGSHRKRAAGNLRKSHIESEKIFILKGKDLGNLRTRLNDLVPDKALVVGLGNIGEYGHKIMKELT